MSDSVSTGARRQERRTGLAPCDRVTARQIDDRIALRLCHASLHVSGQSSRLKADPARRGGPHAMHGVSASTGLSERLWRHEHFSWPGRERCRWLLGAVPGRMHAGSASGLLGGPSACAGFGRCGTLRIGRGYSRPPAGGLEIRVGPGHDGCGGSTHGRRCGDGPRHGRWRCLHRLGEPKEFICTYSSGVQCHLIIDISHARL